MNIDLKNFKYLPVDDNAVDFGFYCTCYGTQKILPNQIYPQKNHPPKYLFKFSEGRILPEYTLVFITDAKSPGILETKEKKQSVPSNSFYLITPSKWHRYRPDFKTGWNEIWIGFNGKTAHSYFKNQTNIKPETVYTPKNFPEIFESACKFTNLLNTQNNFSAGIIAANLFALIAKIEASIEPILRTKISKNENFKDEIKKLIWSWAHTNITVEDIAQEFKISSRTLFRRICEFKNFSIGKEIDTCKISRAKELLLTTDIPIKSIASLSGYKNIYSMRIAFLRNTNKTPKEFRNENSSLKKSLRIDKSSH